MSWRDRIVSLGLLVLGVGFAASMGWLLLLLIENL
jgi:hypothetical protein